jgi:hypothetical protein
VAYKIKSKKWIKTDAWRGYEQSSYAVLGSSDTGTWEDSPCPSYEVDKELKDFQAYLRKKGIGSSIKTAQSSNVFMAKRWVVVQPDDFKEAKKLAGQYLKEKKEETKYIHEAD